MKSIKEITDTWRTNNMAETLPDIPSSYERFAILIIFGVLAGYMATQGNNEAAIGFATTIATYFLSRQGA